MMATWDIASDDSDLAIGGNCEREVVAAFDGLPFASGMSEEVSERMRSPRSFSPSKEHGIFKGNDHLFDH
jgi:hypothetical protein